MSMEIRKYPDPILRKKCQKVREITPEIKRLAKEMTEAMIANEPSGIGLAAPQVGQTVRVIVVSTEKGPAVFINPEITEKSREKESLTEGCLSFPGLFLDIKRPKRVRVQALDKDGQTVKIEAEGLFARVLQHEIDHLDGILFIDRLRFDQKLWALAKYRRKSN